MFTLSTMGSHHLHRLVFGTEFGSDVVAAPTGAGAGGTCGLDAPGDGAGILRRGDAVGRGTVDRRVAETTV